MNYQTVVGWQLKKLVASMRLFPTKIVLTIKKRPKHYYNTTNFTVLSPFPLPIPDINIENQQAVLHNANQYYGIPAPVIPVSAGATGSLTQPPPTSISENNNNYGTSSAIVACCGLPLGRMPPLPIPAQIVNNNSNGGNDSTTTTVAPELMYSVVGPPNPIISSLINRSRSNHNNHDSNNPENYAYPNQMIYEKKTTTTTPAPKTIEKQQQLSDVTTTLSTVQPQQISPIKVIPQTLSQYNAASKYYNLMANNKNNSIKNSTITNHQQSEIVEEKQQQLNNEQNNNSVTMASSSTSPKKKMMMLVGQSVPNNKQKLQKSINNKKNQRSSSKAINVNRCSSAASDSSTPFSMSDSTSTCFTSTEDDEDDDDDDEDDEKEDDDEEEEQISVHERTIRNNNTEIKMLYGQESVSRKKIIKKKNKSRLKNCEFTTEDDEIDPVGEEDDGEMDNDNDSAFYSGRNTLVNELNGSGNCSSSGGSTFGGGRDCSKMPQVLQKLAKLKLNEYQKQQKDEDHDHDYNGETIVSNSQHLDENSSVIKMTTLTTTTSSSTISMPDSVSSSSPSATALSSCNNNNRMNAQTCATLIDNYESSSRDLATNKKIRQFQQSTPKMTSVQLSTITHLTSLAQNIRLANTVPVNLTMAASSSATSSQSKVDSTLSKNIMNDY